MQFLNRLGLHNILLILGALGLIGAMVDFGESVSFLKKSERVTGIVERMEVGDLGDTRAGNSVHPIFKFKTKSNKEVTCSCVSYGSSSQQYYKGEKVTIAYDPQNPSNALAIGYFNMFGSSLIIFSLSLALVISGGGYYLAKPYMKLDAKKINA